VEECIDLDIDLLVRAGLFDHERGVIQWQKYTSDAPERILYRWRPTDVPYCRYLYLAYFVKKNSKADFIEQPMTLLSKPQRRGGARWHFF